MNENKIQEIRRLLKSCTGSELHSVFLLVCSLMQPGRASE